MNLQVVEAIHYRKSKKTGIKIVVTNGSGGSTKAYLLFFIVKLCKIF
jgi:ABC-type antimicrobial peptide transport system ATPase subunit